MSVSGAVGWAKGIVRAPCSAGERGPAPHGHAGGWRAGGCRGHHRAVPAPLFNPTSLTSREGQVSLEYSSRVSPRFPVCLRNAIRSVKVKLSNLGQCLGELCVFCFLQCWWFVENS